MKKFTLLISGFFSLNVFAQFTVTVTASPDLAAKEVYFYTLDGSKDILAAKTKNNNKWSFKYPKEYKGMMKAYFPELNYALNFISENKDVNLNLSTTNGKISNVSYLDPSNKLMNESQDQQRKQEYILPALKEMVRFYNPQSDFAKAVEREIAVLSGVSGVQSATEHPFIAFYNTNYNKFLDQNSGVKPAQQEIVTFISNSNEMLETSSLLRPVLLTYLENVGSGSLEAAADNLLKTVNTETPRGQTVLSELIDIFAASNPQLKEKYLSQAKNLKCTINDRLTQTINSNTKTEVGSIFENYTFNKPFNTSAKSIYDVKADRKVVVFWSSGCSHCERELPNFIPVYSQLKAKSIEIIGLSLDVDKAAYDEKAKQYPWINDTELRGWYSTFNEKYNVNATPTYFVLDKNNKIVAKPDHVEDVLRFLGAK